MSEEESPKKKDKDVLGIPNSDLGMYLGAGAILISLGALAYPLIKPQIDKYQSDMSQRQAYIQQQQLLAAQAQQQRGEQQQQYQTAPSDQNYQEGQQGMIPPPEQQQTPVGDQQYAVEQDPFSKPRRTRIPEIEATEAAGTSRFNNVSI